MQIENLRTQYHREICTKIIRSPKGYPNFADGTNKSSVAIAQGIVDRIGCTKSKVKVRGQTAGGRFETITAQFIKQAFELLQHLRPGDWNYLTVHTEISRFEQYRHLAYIAELVRDDKRLSPALGGDYIVKPDIVVTRSPISDNVINSQSQIVDPETIARFTPLRETNQANPRPILHASISCKWTIRSDRSQNTRTEALNLIRNRKGPVPHIVAVTAEPLPTRLATLALGTGDLDCVYHFALPELADAINYINNEDQLDMLETMIEGHRLRDISDLPFDLAI